MALSKRLIPTTMIKGVDTGKDPKLVQEGLLKAENAIFKRDGMIEKRTGLQKSSGTYDQSHLASFKDQLVCFESKIYMQSGTGVDTSALNEIDNIYHADVDINKIISGNLAMCCFMVDYGDVRAVVYQHYPISGGTLETHVKTFKKTTSRELDHVQLRANIVYGGVRAIWSGDTFYIFYSLANTAFYHRTVNTTTGVISNETGLGGGYTVPGNLPFDVAACGDSSNTVAILYIDNPGTGIVIGTTSGGGATLTSGAVAVVNTGTAVACCQLDEDRVLCCYYDESGAGNHEVKAEIRKADRTQHATAATLWTHATNTIESLVCVKESDSQGRAYYTVDLDPGGASNAGKHRYEVDTNTLTDNAGTGVAGTNYLFCMGCAVTHDPVYVSDNRHFIMLYHSELGQDQLFYTVVENQEWDVSNTEWNPAPVSNMLRGYARWMWLVGSGQLNDDVDLVFPVLYLRGDTYAIAVATCTLNSPTFHTVETQDHLLLGHGAPALFDGSVSFKQGFHHYPFEVDVSLVNVGGGAHTSQTFYYKVAYEWQDRAGNRFLSAPSAASAQIVTGAGGDDVQIVAPTLCIEGQKENVRVNFYRTLNNGSIYYLVQSRLNDHTVQSITITDTASDATISANEVLYTDSGELENIPMRAHTVSCIHKNRVYYVDAEYNQTRVYYSKEFSPGVGLEFNDSLVLNCTAEGGEITALASLLDRLIIFKKDRIYATYGEGLDALGQGRGHPDPELIATGDGCINSETVVLIPGGLAFQSPGGFRLLDNSLNIQNIGDPVKYYTEHQNIRAGAAVPYQDFALWVCSDGQDMRNDEDPQPGHMELHQIIEGDAETADKRGYSVDININGSNGRMIVGIPEEDKAQLYTAQKIGGIFRWSLEKEITGDDTASGDQFGYSVAIGSSYCVVGAYKHNSDAGAVYVFYSSTGNQKQKLTTSAPVSGQQYLGKAVATAGNTILASVDQSAGDNGAVTYLLSGGNFSQTQFITTAGRDIGEKLDIYDDDNLALYGGQSASVDTVGVWTRSGGTWTEQQEISNPLGAVAASFGQGKEPISLHGDYLAVGDDLKGYVYIFKRTGTTWALDQTIGSGASKYGDSVRLSLSALGQDLVLAVRDEFDVLMYQQQQSQFNLAETIETMGAGFDSVGLSSGYMVLGAENDEDPDNPSPLTYGPAYYYQWEPRASALVYHYDAGQWSTFSNHAASDICVANDVYYIRALASDDYIYFENRDEYHDNGGHYPLTVETGWFSFAGLMGCQRVYRALLLMHNHEYHRLRIKTAYDFDPTWIDEQGLTSEEFEYFAVEKHFGALRGDYLDESYLVDIHMSRQKCTAIRISITDVEPTIANDNKGYGISGISFEVGFKQYRPGVYPDSTKGAALGPSGYSGAGGD